MKNKKNTVATVVSMVLAMGGIGDVSAQGLTLEQFLAQAIPTSSNLNVARLREQQAGLQKESIGSRMGWNASGRAGVTHDLSALGSPSDRVDLTGTLEQKLESGNTWGMSGSYSYENVEVNLISSLPDPVHGLNLDLYYKVPLQRGSSNAEIQQGLISAESEAKNAEAQKISQGRALAKQLIDLYFNAVQMKTQISAADEQITRVQRLREFTERNLKLGLVEKRDLYQIQAQEESAIANRRDLAVNWTNLQAELNRLLHQVAGNEVNLASVEENHFEESPPLEQVIKEAVHSSPDRQIQLSQLAISEAQLQIQRDNNQDTMDLQFSVGSRTRYGDLTSGTLNKTDYAAKVNLEYRIAMDKRGQSASVVRTMKDRTIALEQLSDGESRLKYEVNALYQSISEMEKAVTHYRFRLQKEQQKYDEGMREYHAGRVATNLIVQFENDLQAADLALKARMSELAKNKARLNLLRGQYAEIFK